MTDDNMFTNSEAYFFKGQNIGTFTGKLRRTVGTLGFRLLNLGVNGYRELAESGYYPGLENDAAILLWAMHSTWDNKSEPDYSTIDRARRYPAWGIEQVDEWADKNGIYPGGESWGEAQEVFSQVVGDLYTTQAREADSRQDALIADEDDEEIVFEDDQPGKSDSTPMPTDSDASPKQPDIPPHG